MTRRCSTRSQDLPVRVYGAATGPVSRWQSGGMHLTSVTDLDDPRLDDYRGLTDTALRAVTEPAEGLYIAETTTVIERAVAAGHRPRSVLVAERRVEEMARVLGELPVPVLVVSDELAERVTGYAVHRGALASMQRPPSPGRRRDPRGPARSGAGGAG